MTWIRRSIARGSETAIARHRKRRMQEGTLIERMEIRRLMATTPVTISFDHLLQIDNPDEPDDGDYYVVVRFDDGPEYRSSEITGSNFNPLEISASWSFTEQVDISNPTTIYVKLLDDDWEVTRGDDDFMDIVEDPEFEIARIIIDPISGKVLNSNEVPGPFLRGYGEEGHYTAELGFRIDTLFSGQPDSDGDGLYDVWETSGIDTEGDGIVDLDLPSMGANPNHKDLFVELDWMTGDAPRYEEIRTMKAAFAMAPIHAGIYAWDLPNGVNSVMNPDGLPGINLWVDTGSLTDGFGRLVGDNLGGGNSVPFANVSALNSRFYTIKSANFPSDVRALAFRYALSAGTPADITGSSSGGNTTTTLNDASQNWLPGEWAGNTITVNSGGLVQTATIVNNTATQITVAANWTTIPATNSTYTINWGAGGWGEIGGNDMIDYNHDAGSIMHEIGHMLNLRHGGADDLNRKPNYISVMNYDHQFGIPQNTGGNVIDYSPPRISTGGTVSGSNLGTARMTVPSANWVPDQWVGCYLELTSLGSIISRRVVSNDANTIYVDEDWNIFPSGTFSYTLFRPGGSRGNPLLPQIDESLLDERNPLDISDTANRMIFSVSPPQMSGQFIRDTRQYPLNGIVRGSSSINAGPDYDDNGQVDASTGPINVNFHSRQPSGIDAPYRGNDDWSRISLPFRQFGDSSAGAINVSDHPSPTIEELRQAYFASNETDLGLSVIALPTAIQGGIYEISWKVGNQGTHPGDGVLVTTELPIGFTFFEAAGEQGTVVRDGRTVTWNVGAVYPGSPVHLTLRLKPYLAGPLSLTATVSTIDTDIASANDSATASVLVLNAAPEIERLELSSAVVDENGVVWVTVQFTDPGSLDGHSAVIDWGDGVIQSIPVPLFERTFTRSHRYLDDDPGETPFDTRSIVVKVSDAWDEDHESTAVRVNNIAPSLDNVSVTPSIDENGIVTLSGDIVDPGTADTFALIVDWGTGLPVTYPFEAGTTRFVLTHQYLDDDPTATASDFYAIALVLRDDDLGEDTASATTIVNNVAPVLISFESDARNPGDLADGDLLTVSGSFTDAGTADSHSVSIDWGDGTASPAHVVQGAGSGSLTASHLYASGGYYRIVMTLTDDDSGEATAWTYAYMTGVGIVDGVMQIVGTGASDHVTLARQGNGDFRVIANFLEGATRTLPATGVTSIAMFLGDGNDRAEIAGSVMLPAIIDAGGGNDRITGGNGPNLILGGDGDDLLLGGSSHDILVGGLGADRIIGNGGDDILIAGTLVSPADPVALFDESLSILLEWERFRLMSRTRRRLLTGGDDSADVLTGGAGLDWFFLDPAEDTATDKTKESFEPIG